ncbi:PepSY domain-containing protein (plasmid) [Streptomyces sp. BI20]|uniref:PepSY domain-containing protein n=1 Tax=Streptomyces sp. BI20 TaxID=3403460 RepID=UPI003C7433D3
MTPGSAPRTRGPGADSEGGFRGVQEVFRWGRQGGGCAVRRKSCGSVPPQELEVKRSLLSAGVLVALTVPVLVACKGEGGAAAGKAGVVPSASVSVSPEAVAPSASEGKGRETGGPAITHVAAARVAVESVPGGKVTSAKLRDRDGALVWEVDVMTDEPRVHNVTVDPGSGALIGSRADRMPDRARARLRYPLDALALAKVDREKAADLALTAAGGGHVRAVSVQNDDGAARWEVDVRSGDTLHRLDVDGASGAVTVGRSRTDADNSARREADGATDTPARDTRPAEGERGGRPDAETVRELSHDFGRDHYDWNRHVPR